MGWCLIHEHAHRQAEACRQELTSGEKYLFLEASFSTTSRGLPHALASISHVMRRFRITSRACMMPQGGSQHRPASVQIENGHLEA